jgi:hypothetical protein
MSLDSTALNYYFWLNEPETIIKGDFDSVTYHGELVASIPKLSFEALFPHLKIDGAGYRLIEVQAVPIEFPGGRRIYEYKVHQLYV